MNNITQKSSEIKEWVRREAAQLDPAPCNICGEPATVGEYCEQHYNAIETRPRRYYQHPALTIDHLLNYNLRQGRLTLQW